MLRAGVNFIITILLVACASAPKQYAPLEKAKNSQIEIKNKPMTEQVASVILFQAEEYLHNAETALSKKDISNADHYIYLAERKQEVAQELLLKHQHEQEIEKLKQQQREMTAQLHSAEAQRAQSDTKKAQQRVKQLETALGQYKAEETSRGTLLVINDLLFDSGGAKLTIESENRLEPLLQYLLGNPRREIIIEGHTDSVGDAHVNKRLSLQRAESVKNFLISHNISPTRIETRGFGEEVPVATNTTNAGRKLNRRVEIVIKTDPQNEL